VAEDLTVFVVDDDPAALESLRWMIEQAGFHVKVFSSGGQFLNSYRIEERGVLVLDVRMPEMDGLELQQKLRELRIRLPIVFITAYGDVRTCASAFREGAVDFLEKPVNDKVLLDHIEKRLARRETEIRQECVADLFGDRINLLTPAESEILGSLMLGRSIKGIARARKISVQTVWRHQESIFKKIGVESQVELVRVVTQWQMQHGHQLPDAEQ
jgi:two-component system response regulator TtrR